MPITSKIVSILVRSISSYRTIISSRRINSSPRFSLAQPATNTSLPPSIEPGSAYRYFSLHSHLILLSGKFLSIKKRWVNLSPYSSNDSNFSSLGQTLHNVIKNIPGGVLVFFPCYKMIEECVATWKVCCLGRSSVTSINELLLRRIEQCHLWDHESTETSVDRTTE